MILQAVAGLATGLVLLDPRGRIVWLNRAAERLFGVVAEQCIGRPYGRVFVDPGLSGFWEQATRQVGECLGNISVRYPRTMELKLNATICFANNGQEIGRALLCCDVTTDRNIRVELSQEMARRLRNLADENGATPNVMAQLTSAELRTFRVVGRGLSNDAVARELSVAVSTVRSHLKSIYRKLDLPSRAAAVRFASQNHLS